MTDEKRFQKFITKVNSSTKLFTPGPASSNFGKP